MKKKTLLLALIPALLLAPSCSATNTTGGMKAHDVVIKNETTNDKYGEKPALLKEGRRNLEATTASIDDVAVSTSSKDGDLILTFAISESLESVLLAANVTTVSVYYGYVAYENDAVSNDVVLAHGAKIDYDLANGRIIRLIIKDRGTADYADKKYQGVLAYTLNETQYVSETQSITQTWETVTENVIDNVVSGYNAELTTEAENQYNNQETIKLTTKGDLGKKVYSHANILLSSLKGNFSGAKLSFVAKLSNVTNDCINFRLTDESNNKLDGIADALCRPTSPSTGVVCELLEGGWYRYSVDFSVAFSSLQNNQMLEATYSQLVFTNDEVGSVANVLISDVSLERQSKATIDAPIINLTGNTITWNNVKNAASYSLYKNDILKETFATTDALTYTDDDNSVGVHEYKVVANTDGKGYFYSSSANVSKKVTDESVEQSDISNNIVRVTGVTLNQNNDAFYNGAWSKKVTMTKAYGAFKILASDLAGIEGKTLTFYTQMIDASAVTGGYLHLFIDYYNSSDQKLGTQGKHYISLTKNHDVGLGTFEKMEGTNWMKSTFKLDDSAFGKIVSNEVSYVRIQIGEMCTFNIDAMTVTDTPTA